MADAVNWYDANAEAVAARYEALASEDVHRWLLDLLPQRPAVILDVGAGSGRDAAWLAKEGYEVVAVDPSTAMRSATEKRHTGTAIQWIADALPSLEKTIRSGLSFDLILLSAAWHLTKS